MAGMFRLTSLGPRGLMVFEPGERRTLQGQEGCTIEVKEYQPDTHLNMSFLKQQITEVAVSSLCDWRGYLRSGRTESPTEVGVLKWMTKPEMPVVELQGRHRFRVPFSLGVRTLPDRCDEDCTRDVLDKRLQKLKSSQIEDLAAFAKKESVGIHKLKSGGQVRLKGPLQGLTKVCHYLDQILQTVADFGFVAYPTCWESVESDQRVFKVAEGSIEYKSVKNSFMAAFCEKRYHATIFKIERIQIPDLYKQYQIAMQTVKKEHPFQDNERIMWHGTDVEAVPNINKYGFNRSYSGKNAALFGQGVYFAVDASTSSMDMYSPPDTHGIKYVYRARVLTGRYTKGDAKMRDPPRVDPSRSVRFTSTTDDTSRPSLFCIYRDTHSYPEYLISFQLSLPQTS